MLHKKKVKEAPKNLRNGKFIFMKKKCKCSLYYASLASRLAKISKKEEMLRNRLREQEKQYEKMILLLITTGEADKLIDLLSKININLEFKDSDGNTPFNIAAQNGYADIARILLRYGS